MKRAGWIMVGILALAVALGGCALFNTPPLASFTATPATGSAPLVVEFDASASTDPDGDALVYGWDFDDGATGSSVSGFHAFADPGSYEVELEVTDEHGAVATMTRQILVTVPINEAPAASFVASPVSGTAPLVVSFNAASSSDADGTIASYAWQFGDGDAGTGVTVTHTYTAAGAYVASLTVEDDDTATDSSTQVVIVSAPGNQLPVPSFTMDPMVGTAPLTVDFDATASADPDGSIIAYQWDFGDGDSATGVTTSHTFDVSGTYTVVLTVVDNTGAPASAVDELTVWFPWFPIGPIVVGPIFP